jgi:hypothetical protein
MLLLLCGLCANEAMELCVDAADAAGVSEEGEWKKPDSSNTQGVIFDGQEGQ